MGWDTFLATGSGRLSWRLTIEGIATEFVSSATMETTSGGRKRIVALRSDSVQLEERPSLATGELDSSGFAAKLVDVDEAVTEALALPSLVTYLEADLSVSATTATVSSTEGFPSSGYFHVGTECIQYTGKTATTFTGLVRGAWDTVEQSHYTFDGALVRYPEVTDRPSTLEGRRVRLYAYGSTDRTLTVDSPTGDGTQAWLGVVSTDPRYSGGEWSIQIDPITRILGQTLGADLEEPVGLRGIYYPESTPLVVDLSYNDTGESLLGPFAETVTLSITGFYSSQDEFVDALNGLIEADSTVAGWETQPRAVSDGEGGWYVRCTTSSTKRGLRVTWSSPVDGLERAKFARASLDADASVSSASDSTLTGGVYYVTTREAGAGSVPRAVIQAGDRIYLSGAAAVTSRTNWAQIEIAGEQLPFRISSQDTSSRYVVTSPEIPPGLDEVSGRVGALARTSYRVALSSLPVNSAVSVQIRLGRGYDARDLHELLTQLVADTPGYVNSGAVPLLQSGDFGARPELVEAIGESPVAAQRSYVFWSSVELGELLKEECKLAGVFPALDSAGRITFRRLRLPSATEPGAATIGPGDILVNNGWPTLERSAMGLYNTVLLRTQYDPLTDDHTGAQVTVRDVAAYGRSPNTRTLEVAPFSALASGDPPRYEWVLQMASRVLGVFGDSYDTITIEVPMTLFKIVVGDVVLVTSDKIPDPSGSLGVSAAPMLVIARTWSPMEGRGVLTLMRPSRRIAGYAPAARVSTTFSGTSGNVTVTKTGYLPDGYDCTDFWAVGDKIRVSRWGAATAGAIHGQVSAVSADGLGVALDSAWTPGTSLWMVETPPSDTTGLSRQRLFAFVAGSNARLDYSTGSRQADFFAP